MELNIEQLNELCKVAKQAAVEAGEFIQASLNSDYQHLDNKKGMSDASKIVTEVDLKSQDIILKYLNPTLEAYDLGLLTEEKVDDESRLIKDYFWCIDPLDGTLSFSQKQTGYAVSIALVNKKGESVIGVVVVPDLGDTYSSIKGKGVYKNEVLFTVNETKQDTLSVFSDNSLQKGFNYNSVLSSLNNVVRDLGCSSGFEIIFGYGAVMNAINTMSNDMACYFKFQKDQLGGGAIWDFAATNLFFDELGLIVSDRNRNKLDFNDAETVYMNHCGVMYSSNQKVADSIFDIR